MASDSSRTIVQDLLGAEQAGALAADGRPVVLWAGDDARVLWMSETAAKLLGASGAARPIFSAATPALSRIRAFGASATDGEARREPLRFFMGSRFVTHDAENRLLVLTSGAKAVLTLFGPAPTAASEPAAVSDTPDAKVDAAPEAKAGPAEARTEPPARSDDPARTAVPAPPAVPAARAVSPPASPAAAPVPSVEGVLAPMRTVHAEEQAAKAEQPKEPAGPSAVVPETPAPARQNDGTAVAPPKPARPTRPVRFVFQTDATGALTMLSPGFAAATGHAPAHYSGRALGEVLAGFSPEAGARVTKAIADHATWNGIGVDWPTAEGDALIPTELSGAPILGPDRAPTGYSGFGVCRMDRMRERPVPEPVEDLPPPAGAAAPASTGAEHPTATPANTPAVASVSVVPPSSLAQTDSDSDVDEEELDSETLGTDTDESDIIAALPAPDLSPAPLPPEKPALPTKPVQDNARQPDFGDQRVVALPNMRGPVGASMAGGNVVPMKPSAEGPKAPVGPGLSMAERHAFREIARALGARFEGAEPAAAPEAAKAAAALPSATKTAATLAPDAKAAEPLPPAAKPAEAVSSGALAVSPPVQQPVAATARPANSLLDGLGDTLVERLPIGVLVFRGTETLYLNRPMLDLTGYADIASFRTQDGLGKLFQSRLAPNLESGGFDTVTINGRDGQSLPVDAHLQTIDWQGAPATMVSFRRALDAEHGPRAHNLEIELKARRADLAEARAMLDTATDGVISLDDNGRILALNRSAEALFGYDQKELAGERLTLLLAPESHALALDYLDGLKANGVASVLNDGREIIGKERNGGRIPLFMTVGRVNETGKFAAVVRDLTAWKRAESELTEAKRAAERASALKSDFLAKISHEIRTPMNAIIGFAEVMRDERLGPIGTERYKEYLKDIHTSGEHVISLVNDLLDLSKIEAGRMDLTFGSVDLNAVVSSCLGIMQPQANRDRVIMRSQLSPKLPPVVADERSIRQIVLNLLSNASKFTEPGGQVIISTALTEAGEAVIRVRDTGIGMTDSEVQAALEPFRQLSTTRHRGGTGLGLPLTKALVEANRAAFAIRSKSREGTLVEVTFPPTRVLAE